MTSGLAWWRYSLLDRIIECAKRYVISFATEQGGEERKKNKATARKFDLSDDDRIRIVCGLRPEEFYRVMPEHEVDDSKVT